MQKTIAVVHGGVGEDRDKSLRYGKTVTKVFRDAGNNVVEIHLHPNGSWTRDGQVEHLEKALSGVKYVWNSLLGDEGEVGLVENLCEKCKVKLLGHGSLHTNISNDKKNLKTVLKQHKIKTPYSKVLRKKDLSSENIKEAYRMVGVPMIVKPNNSSGGKNIFFVNNFGDLQVALENIFTKGYDALLEKPILGKDISVFVFTHGGLTHAHVYSKEALTRDESILVRNEALFIHSVLAYKHHLKYDFILNEKGLYFLEANTHTDLLSPVHKKYFMESGVSLSEYLLGKL